MALHGGGARSRASTARAVRGCLVLFTLAAFVAAGVGCGTGEEGTAPGAEYKASIRRTSFGIPHILANDLGSAGFGLGYAAAQDYVCILADQIVKVRSERSRYFGPGDKNANVETDFGILAAQVHEAAEAEYSTLSADSRSILDGFAAGYNHYLDQTPAADLPVDCKDADWVKPISSQDLLAYYYWLALQASIEPLLPYISSAAPPGSALWIQPEKSFRRLRVRMHPGLGSNGWAIGRDRSESGYGMLVANPHFPWEGNRKFHEFELTVPGKVHVYGVGLLGAAMVNIGFNEHIAWTHTVTTAQHFTVYKLTLESGDPTSYVYDGSPRAMTSRTYDIDVKQPDGTLAKETRTLWRSHYGPMLNLPVLGWSTAIAFSVRDANENNFEILPQFLRTNMATSLDDLDQINRDVHGIPWVNTMATDPAGTAYYADASRVPNLGAATVTAYKSALQSDLTTQLLAQQGLTLLDGSTSRDEWVETNGSPIVPFDQSPKLRRSDFTFNSNDSYWLTNPAQPLEGYPMLFGSERTPRSPRTRMNLFMLTETGSTAASGIDNKFSFEELSAVPFNDRASIAELLRDQVVQRCKGAGPVQISGASVSVADACSALESWNLRLDNDSVGALVWRELLSSYAGDVRDKGALFANPFDPDNPVATPNGLAGPTTKSTADPLLTALGKAVDNLQQAGFSVTTRLGDAQHARKGSELIPIHGGNNIEGAFNIVGYGPDVGTLLPYTQRGTVISAPTGLTDQGYLVNNGTSFVMVLEFTGSGPHARALLTYSESSDPASPHYSDQTKRFSDKQWRPVLFTEEEIAADPNLVTTEVQAGRP